MTPVEIQTFAAGEFAENGYLVRCDEKGTSIVIDPGAGASDMVEALRTGDLRLAAIVLTHAHLDHVEGIPTILEHREVPIHLHPADLPLYRSVPDQARSFGVPVTDLPPPDRELEHGERLEFGDAAFEIRHAPGHAPGHVILRATSEELAFVGDVVFRGSIGRTDLPGGNYRELMESIREQVLTLPDDTRLLTGHGPETTVEAERTGNPFLVPHYGGELA